MSATPDRRRVRSYVLRQSRITPAQELAIQQHWHRFGIDYQPQTLDLSQVFGRSAPKVLEIGTGTGENIVALANRHSDNDYLALEVHTPGVGKLIRQAVALNLSNIRVICHDAVEVLAHQIDDKTLDQILIFFPDPWPKKRHHKRRLLQPEFVALLRRKLQDHGRLFLATDWQDLAEHMLRVCDAEGELFNLAGRGNYSPRPKWRPLTKFEQRGRHLQHQVWDLAYAVNG
ncbi:MAG: tRNA (guanosine(46)-N7)-methyltransferase TrmB [Gammaproteobacteria bacterium RIFCSPLOWO2_12_FULL_52_10]|nr:MAG: tRNA (guanosine(46)-N7)-methyltransferase TrmB [Gammaproteobacteria bacterium RIFCSPLOWO2_12_FULL_52_10]